MDFEPIIANKSKSHLKEKQVNIKGTNDFGRIPSQSILGTSGIKNANFLTENKKESNNLKDTFLKATKTAKVSPDVLLRLNTLKPFIEELENEEKITINDMISMLITNYTNTRLTTRQKEGYDQMYQKLLEFTKK